ncbi:PEPxxWA-CTERM sorting domain-containing protein [uncultured Parasphingorhabdus sp.]|uniref:PEPxxWA-CTERM sorting domain-containing protein n=1 Tax=uncultured Parasphingorhabdus sp. TaxID=2709694 RepID=UPI0030D9B40E|tara:strand:+ start:42968 stop:43669 length:702 start_codon:yes stop_codon:yes gene_type:complete
MKISVFAVVATGALFSSSAAFGATTIFNDRTSFDSATGVNTIIDFEGCPGGTGLSNNQSVSSGSGPCSGVAAGITFTPENGGNFYIAAAGQSSNPTIALGTDFPLGGVMSISLDNPTDVFGADFFQNFGGGSQSGANAPFIFYLFNGATLLDTINFDVASGGGSFFGVTSTNSFDRVELGQTNGFAVIDNVAFGSLTGAVPEPATWAFMIFGFGAIGGALRRQRKANVKVSYA